MSALGLLGQYESGSSSSSSEEEAEEEEEKNAPTSAPQLSNPFKSSSSFSSSPSHLRLPKPSFMSEQESLLSSSSVSSSVFSNPFREKEEAKKALLERHVAMTIRQEERKTIDGKKVCWNFRKGRCRFGHKCTFAHDSDVGLKKPDPASFEPNFTSGPSSSSPVAPVGAIPPVALSPSPPPPPAVGASYNEGSVITGEDTQGLAVAMRKKKRPGLSQDITPSKKAMKFHNKVYNNSVS